MMHAYDECYLGQAKKTLARMLDYAFYGLKYDLSDFFDLFLNTDIAERFGNGDCGVIAGRSGVELAWEVLELSGLHVPDDRPNIPIDRTPEYWTGWALAHFQWYSGLPFATIVRYVPVMEIRGMYGPFHEMDILQFIDRMNGYLGERELSTNLKIRRQASGLSQSQLAHRTGIPVRTIQQYEQGQKNINKAQAEYLVILSRELCCRVSDLMEY